MTSAMSAFRPCARHALMLAVRSRWTLMFAALFTTLSLGVALSGYVLTGGHGLQDFARTAASLVELVVVLVPMASLIFGVFALTPEAGSTELLYSQPSSRSSIFGGTLTGLWLALVAAQAIGFGISGLVLFTRTGDAGLASFVAVAVASFVLTAIFLSLAAALAAGRSSRARARTLALALTVWFVLAVAFDAGALAAATMLPSGPGSRLLMIAVIVNPVGAIRTATLMAVEGTAAFGGASLAFLRFTSGAAGAALWLGLSAVAWIGVPLAIAFRRLERADL